MKIKKIILILFCIICLSIVPYYVDASSNNVTSVSSQTVSLNSEFYLILNLSNIPFTKFKVEIENTSSLKSNNMTSKVSELSNNAGLTSFVLDKNTTSGLEKLGIAYTLSETSKVDFKINIICLDKNESDSQIEQLTNELNELNKNLNNLKNTLSEIDETSDDYETITKEIEELQNEIDSKNKEIDNLKNPVSGITENKISETVTVNVTDISEEEKNQSNKLPYGDMDSMMKDKELMDKDNEKMSASMKEMMSKMNDLEFDLETANNKISSLTTSTTYQGSQNNYLKSLSINNVEFKNEFKKTTSNYFAVIDKDISNVTVNAVAEDSSAIVTIYGNTDLKEGKNKIIVSVTSEDGSVRNYKIYITK